MVRGRPDELNATIDDARHYAEDILPLIAEADRLSELTCEDRILQPSEDIMRTYHELVSVRERCDTSGFEKDHLEAQLKVRINTASGIDRVADWRSTVMHRVDTERLKTDRPDIYTAFLAEARSRRFNLL